MISIFVLEPYIKDQEIAAIHLGNRITGGNILECIQTELLFSEVSGRDVFGGGRVLNFSPSKNLAEYTHLFDSFVDWTLPSNVTCVPSALLRDYQD